MQDLASTVRAIGACQARSGRSRRRPILVPVSWILPAAVMPVHITTTATSAGHRRSAVPGSGRIEVATQVGDTTAPRRPTLDCDLA